MITIFMSGLNEENFLESAVENTIKAARNAGNIKLDIVIVDDASTDKTPEVIDKLEKKYSFVRSICHRQNQGLGTGIKEVIKIAKYPKFMIVPGDNDADVDLLTRLMRARNKADLILSYYLNKESRSRWRNFISMIYGLIYMITFDVYVQYINSPCVYTTKILKTFDIKSSRFSITAEIAVKYLRSGVTLYEMPGLMQTGAEGSASLKPENLLEIIVIYFRLVYEIFLEKRLLFNKKYIRVID